MTTTNQDEARLAELAAVFVTLDDKAKDSAIAILVGLLLSVICVRSEESRSAVNILSTVISVALVLMMLGIVALNRSPFFFKYSIVKLER